jgi:hypothetical protein
MEMRGTLMELRGTLMELRNVERMARKYGGELGDQVGAASRALRPYGKQARKRALQLSRDLRPLAKKATAFAKKHPGGTVVGALCVGYLLAWLRR